MSKISFALLILLVSLTLVAGCSAPTEPGLSATAQMLPNLSGYQTVEGQSFTDALTNLGVMATLAGQPQFGAPIATIGEVVGCYQEAGAVSARVYSDEAEPFNTGVIAIGDREALQDPLIFLRCAPGLVGGATAQQVTLQPCSHSYTLPKGDTEFYILYAGLTPDVCHAFCSNLEGCTMH